MDPIKPEFNRKEDGKFGPGNNANPNGRPKGKTLKEFAREYLMNLPDDEKMAYLKTLPQEIVWKMAEGNPHNTQDLTSKDQPVQAVLVQFIDKPEDVEDHTDPNGVPSAV